MAIIELLLFFFYIIELLVIDISFEIIIGNFQMLLLGIISVVTGNSQNN